MNEISDITNETFGQSRAIHPPVDETIKIYLDKRLGYYVESTNENKGTSSTVLWVVVASVEGLPTTQWVKTTTQRK